MPIYEYQCDACGNRFEQIQKFADAPSDTCTVCGKGPIRRLLSSPAIQFKGAGWYVTDYAKKSGEPSKTGDKSEKAEQGDKTEKSDKAESTTSPEKSESKPAASESKPAASTTETAPKKS